MHQEKLHNIDMALIRRPVQRRIAVFILSIWVCAFFQQLFYSLRIAREGGFVEVGLVHGVSCAVFNILVSLLLEFCRFEVSLRCVEGLFVLKNGVGIGDVLGGESA